MNRRRRARRRTARDVRRGAADHEPLLQDCCVRAGTVTPQTDAGGRTAAGWHVVPPLGGGPIGRVCAQDIFTVAGHIALPVTEGGKFRGTLWLARGSERRFRTHRTRLPNEAVRSAYLLVRRSRGCCRPASDGFAGAAGLAAGSVAAARAGPRHVPASRADHHRPGAGPGPLSPPGLVTALVVIAVVTVAASHPAPFNDLTAHRDRREMINEPCQGCGTVSAVPEAAASQHVLGRGSGHVAPLIAGTFPIHADRRYRPHAAAGPSCRPSCPRRTPDRANRMSRPPARRPRQPREWWCGGPQRSGYSCWCTAPSAPSCTRQHWTPASTPTGSGSPAPCAWYPARSPPRRGFPLDWPACCPVPWLRSSATSVSLPAGSLPVRLATGEDQVGGDDEKGADDRLGEVVGAGVHADGRAPDRRGGVDAADADAVPQDDACAEEPDPGYHVGGYPGRVDAVPAGQLDGEQLEQRRPERDRRAGPQTGHPLAPLPLEPDHCAESAGGDGPPAEDSSPARRGGGQAAAYGSPFDSRREAASLRVSSAFPSLVLAAAAARRAPAWWSGRRLGHGNGL